MSTRHTLVLGGSLAAALTLTAACNPPGQLAASNDTSIAAKTFVAPGE